MTIRIDPEDAQRAWVTSGDTTPGAPERLLLTKEPEDEVQPFADEVRAVFEDRLRVLHPELLVARPVGPTAEYVTVLLHLSTEELPEATPAGAGPATADMGSDGWQDSVLQLVRAIEPNALAEVDDDGDLVLRLGSEPPILVMREERLPVMTIRALVACNVYSKRSAAVETAILNNRLPFVVWKLCDRSVLLQDTVFTDPFVPEHFQRTLRLFLDSLIGNREDLVFRRGATTP